MLKKRARFWLAMSIMISVLALGLACGKKEEAGDSGGGDTGPTTGTKYAATGNEGTVTGKINLNGDSSCSAEDRHVSGRQLRFQEPERRCRDHRR